MSLLARGLPVPSPSLPPPPPSLPPSHPLPPTPLRLFETLQSLFWSVFGLLNLYVTNVKARHEFTEFVGATMFGTYNVISLVVLLNMLIAMMNNSYQLIAVSSGTNTETTLIL